MRGLKEAGLVDRAGREYWDDTWGNDQLPSAPDPEDASLGNYVTRRFHELFVRELPRALAGRRLLEVGCARSTWLPYFATRHGFEVTGLDYSAAGAEQARRILQRAGVAGRVVEGDLFAPPEDLLGQFDAVVSFGLVEHFTDTGAALAALARFLKPDGMILTTTPNMGGSLVGLLQKMLNRAVYDVHEPITRGRMAVAHGQADLQLSWCRYFLSVNLSVVNIGSWQNTRRRDRVMRILSRVSKTAWMLERLGLRVPPNRLTSPYIAAVARRRPGTGVDDS
jgi:2-polyprenyl-3-methyl-5-hydroxy-6-metoxy-1,4-benzoquinol methylase